MRDNKRGADKMRSTRKRLLLTTSLLVLDGGHATAQETFELDVIRIESQEAQDVLGNTEVSEEEIEDTNPSTLSEVFQGETAVTVSGGADIAQKVFVNGIEESLLSVTIDDARQNKSAFHHTGNVLINPTLLKSVEVSSGLAPADAGPGALAGLIAYETKDARDFLAPGETLGGLATLGYGSNGHEGRGSLTVFGMQGGFDFMLSGTRTSGDDYEDGSGDVVRGTEPDLSAVTAKLGYTGVGGHRLEFWAEQVKDEGQRPMQLGPGGLYYARPDFAGVVDRPSVYRPALSERTSYTLTYTDETPEGIWAPIAQLSYNKQDVEAGAAIGTNTSLSGKLENAVPLADGVLTAGVDFFHDTAEADGPLTVHPAEETLDNVGLYAQMRHDIGSRVSLSYGARFDAQHFELADGTDHSDSGISVNAAADVILTDTLTLNVGAASTWGGYELSEASLIDMGSPWDYGEPTASRGTSARLALRYDSGPWSASAALFYTEVEDVNDVLTPSRQTSNLTSRGVDASLGYAGERGYVLLNYTRADVELDDEVISSTAYYTGRPVGHLFGVEAAYDVTPDLRLGGTAELAPAYDVPDGMGGEVELDAYEAVNVFASYVPPRYENLEVRLDVRNLFDETYARHASDGVGMPGRIIPLNEPGRSIGLTVSMRF